MNFPRSRLALLITSATAFCPTSTWSVLWWMFCCSNHQNSNVFPLYFLLCKELDKVFWFGGLFFFIFEWLGIIRSSSHLTFPRHIPVLLIPCKHLELGCQTQRIKKKRVSKECIPSHPTSSGLCIVGQSLCMSVGADFLPVPFLWISSGSPSVPHVRFETACIPWAVHHSLLGKGDTRKIPSQKTSGLLQI